MNLIEGLTGQTLPMFLIVCGMTFGAAAIRGLTGFGMAIILVPLLGLIIRPDAAVVLAILLQLLIGPVGLRTVLADSHKSTAIPIALVAIMTTPAGIWLLAYTPPDVARVAIAGIALAAFLLVLLPIRNPKVPGLGMAALTGAAAGVLTGFAAMPGPPVVPFYMRSGLSAIVVRASMMFVFFATAIAGTLASWLIGLADVQLVVLSLCLLPALLLGNWAGGLAFGKVPEALWRSIVGLVLGLAGISAVLRVL